MSGTTVTVRRMVWTGAFAAVTIVGTIYGAGLKTRLEFDTEKKKILEATTDEKVAVLEQRRRGLEAQKVALEKKLAALHERMSEEERRGEDR